MLKRMQHQEVYVHRVYEHVELHANQIAEARFLLLNPMLAKILLPA